MSQGINVSIAGKDYFLSYDFEITSRGSSMVGPSWNSPGEPAEAAEFVVTVEDLQEDLGGGKLGPSLEIPRWLNDALSAALYDSEKVNDVVQEHDMDRGSDDYEY
jgi:hypothetical protein